MSDNKNNKYKIIDFTYSQSNDEKDLRYELKNYKYEKKYMISKEDYEKGVKYLEQNHRHANPYKLFYFYNFKNIINNLKTNDYVLVNEKFLEDLKCDKNYYKDNFVVDFESDGRHFIYFNDEQILEITEVKEENSEESDENEIKEEETEENQKNNNKSNKEDKNQEKNILKSLILLFANEKLFQKLLNSSIVDEYDFKEYYLINKEFVDDYIKNTDYKNLCEKLDTEEYSYNGFYFNIDKIIDKLKLSNIKIKSKTYEEKKFYPLLNEIDFPKKDKKIKCLDKFIIVPENLFDLLYICINEKNYKKEDYKYKILIGDQTLFIQDKNIKSNFLAYRYEHDKFKLFYYFGFDEELSFYEVVKKHIKEKGLLNYVSEVNLDKNKKDKVQILKDKDGNSIGKYLNIRKIDNNEIKEIKSNMIIQRLKKISMSHNSLKNNLMILKPNNIETLNINDICKKINKGELYCLKVGIILNDDLINLKKKLLLNEVSDLINEEGKKEYKNIEKKLIKKLSDFDEKNFKNIADEIAIYNPNLLDKESNKDNDYNLINYDIKEVIIDSNETKDIQDCYYFKIKNEYYIIFSDRKKLYKINYNQEEDNFKLEEYISKEDKNSQMEKQKKNEEKIYKKLFDNIKDLKENDEYIQNKLKSKFEKFLSLDAYYLVSSNWINELKRNLKNEDKKVKLPDLLFLKDNLRPKDLQDKIKYKKEVPIDFDIINKKLFETILENLNSLNINEELKSDYLFDVSFACNYILVKELNSNDIFIYSIENGKYKLDYIISLNDDSKLKDLFNNCKDFDEFLNKYYLNLSTNETQDIEIKYTKKKITEKKKIGEFICINPKEEDKIEEQEEEEEEKKEEKKKKKRKKRPKNSDKNSDTIPEEPKPVHCLGLENIGATCYMNATIQCLCNVAKFKDYFLNSALINSVTMNRNCPLTLEFASLINHLWKLPKDNNNKTYYNPTPFKNIISQMDTLFQGIAANDSKDLILFIYENIHREIHTTLYNNNPYNLYNCNNDYELANFRNSYYPLNSSIIADTFYYEQQNCIKCTRCNFNKVSYTIANIVIFPLEKVRQYIFQTSNGNKNSVSLDDCFMQNQMGELLNGPNQIYCNTCGGMTDALMVNYMNTSPEVLTIILNRGKGLEFNVDFHFDHYINIDNYVLDKTNNKSNLYELICILCHYGPSGMSGHFIAFCKSPVDKAWYCYNDASVTECEGDPDISKYGNIEGIPYVLYYQRYDANNNNAQNGNNDLLKQQIKNYTQANQSNINNNYNNYNEETQISNNTNNYQENKSNKGKISLVFIFNDNSYDLDIEKNKKIEDLIKNLKKKYKIFKKKDIMVCSQKNNMQPLNYDMKINECDLDDNDVLVVLEM